MPSGLAPALKTLDRLNRRVAAAMTRLSELARSRTGDEKIQDQLIEVLQRWYLLGREPHQPSGTDAPESGPVDS